MVARNPGLCKKESPLLWKIKANSGSSHFSVFPFNDPYSRHLLAWALGRSSTRRSIILPSQYRRRNDLNRHFDQCARIQSYSFCRGLYFVSSRLVPSPWDMLFLFWISLHSLAIRQPSSSYFSCSCPIFPYQAHSSSKKNKMAVCLGFSFRCQRDGIGNGVVAPHHGVPSIFLIGHSYGFILDSIFAGRAYPFRHLEPDFGFDRRVYLWTDSGPQLDHSRGTHPTGTFIEIPIS